MKDIQQFALAFFKHWSALLTGGMAVAVIWLFGVVTRRPAPIWVDWLLIGSTFAFAAFQTWRDETQSHRETKNHLQAALSDLKRDCGGSTGVCDVDPVFLYGLFKNHTKLQAKRLVEIYLNQVVIWKLLVYDICGETDCPRIHAEWPNIVVGSIMINLHEKSFALARTLRRGQTIRIKGRITDVEPTLIEIDEGMLL